MFASRAIARSSGLRAINSSIKSSAVKTSTINFAARPLSTSAFRLSVHNDKTAAENAVFKHSPPKESGRVSSLPNKTLDRFKLTGKVAVVTGYVSIFSFSFIAIELCQALIAVCGGLRCASVRTTFLVQDMG